MSNDAMLALTLTRTLTLALDPDPDPGPDPHAAVQAKTRRSLTRRCLALWMA
jgi:hypothetical protein